MGLDYGLQKRCLKLKSINDRFVSNKYAVFHFRRH